MCGSSKVSNSLQGLVFISKVAQSPQVILNYVMTPSTSQPVVETSCFLNNGPSNIRLLQHIQPFSVKPFIKHSPLGCLFPSIQPEDSIGVHTRHCIVSRCTISVH